MRITLILLLLVVVVAPILASSSSSKDSSSKSSSSSSKDTSSKSSSTSSKDTAAKASAPKSEPKATAPAPKPEPKAPVPAPKPETKVPAPALKPEPKVPVPAPKPETKVPVPAPKTETKVAVPTSKPAPKVPVPAPKPEPTQPKTPTQPQTPTQPKTQPAAPSNAKGGLAILEAAKSRIDTPYSFGGGGRDGKSLGTAQGAKTVGFDCSGLVQYAVYKATGKTLTRHSGDQSTDKQCKQVSYDQRQAGDLVFFQSNNVIHHVGVVDQDPDYMINAPKTGTLVRRDKIWSEKSGRVDTVTRCW